MTSIWSSRKSRSNRPLSSLTKEGFEIERPPEDWLFKAHLDGAMVDVLHRLNGIPVDAEFLDRAEMCEVLGCASLSCSRPT